MTRMGERAMAVITTWSVGEADGRSRTPIAPPALDDVRFVAQTLVAEGFELLNFHPLAISFAGAPKAFERVFGVRLEKRSFAGGRGRRVEAFDIEPADAHRLTALPEIFESRAVALAIARPPRLIDDASAPVRDVAPTDSPAWSLPDELAISIWADGAAAPPATGRGVVAALIGTGCYRHRFFADRGYRLLPTLLGPGQTAPQRDDHGHSTGEAAYMFAAAPDLRLRPVKGLIDPIGDILMTLDSHPKPDVIVNSWGYDVDHASWGELAETDRNLHLYLRILEAAIAHATAQGVVLCAAAPRTWRSFPACHPDVIAVGAASNGRAAHQASQGVGVSRLYPGRITPDLWSDAAKSVRPGLDLINGAHPVQPGATLSQPGLGESGGGDDGFAWCDVEQAACPLAASMLSLLLEQHRGVTPSAFKTMTIEAALSGESNGEPALIQCPTAEAAAAAIGARAVQPDRAVSA